MSEYLVIDKRYQGRNIFDNQADAIEHAKKIIRENKGKPAPYNKPAVTEFAVVKVTADVLIEETPIKVVYADKSHF